MIVRGAAICNEFEIRDGLVNMREGFATNWALPAPPPMQVRIPFVLAVELEPTDDLKRGLGFEIVVLLQEGGELVGECLPNGQEIEFKTQPVGSPSVVTMGVVLDCHFEQVGGHFVRVRDIDQNVLCEVPFGVYLPL